MKKFSVAILFSLIFIEILRADIVLDQEYDFVSAVASTTSGDVIEVGQTFTAGLNGQLDHIDVLMFRLDGIFTPTGNPVLRVYNTDNGLPSGAPLALITGSIASVPLAVGGNPPGFVTFDVSGAGIQVSAGEVLAFSVIAASGVGPYFLPNRPSGLPNSYEAGQGLTRISSNSWQPLAGGGGDHGFRTFVNTAAVPEPTASGILLSGGLLASLRRRRVIGNPRTLLPSHR